MRAIGLMSGTSADGIDAALIESDGISVHTLGQGISIPYASDFRSKLIKMYGMRPSPVTQGIETQLTLKHAEAVHRLLEHTDMTPGDIDVIGFHGQTILHCPPQKGKNGETFQLGEGQLLADETGIPVVFQFRQRDMQLGGQGAPLVPVFHQALTQGIPTKPVCVVNIGGVANITWIGGGGDDLLAFDTGPGNALIDDWVQQHRSVPCDMDGRIAASGCACPNILEQWLTHPYFRQTPPKSLDRETFRTWCFENPQFQSLSFEDQIASLTELTALTLHHAHHFFPSPPKELILAGGGSCNPTLVSHLKRYWREPTISYASDHGWDGNLLEAHAFAFLAIRSTLGLPLTYPTTTGASRSISGGVAFKPLGLPSNRMA